MKNKGLWKNKSLQQRESEEALTEIKKLQNELNLLWDQENIQW